ncbi:MAG TPA: N-acetylmuramoyl-L-alanine amidase, partial [Solibacterales bacterium]|nr:N-acetylmuramoyl-L-alanine amidase [Bryobacterales bacterium]
MIELHAPSDKPPAAPPVLLAKTLVTTPHPVIREPDTTPAPITSFAPDLPATLREDHTAAVFAKAEVKTPATLPSPPVLTPKVSEPERPSERASFNASARAARLAATQSMTRALGLKINRVVIDAGHGGHDQGTSGPHGLLEKDLTLDVAQRLGKLIEQRLGSEVIYTRSDDTYIGLHERTAIANRSKADLFLSIHANSSKATGVTGVETYYLNFTSSAESMNVAARENATAENSVFELKDLVQTITLH